LLLQTAQDSRDFQLACELLTATPEVVTRFRHPLTVQLDGFRLWLRQLNAMLAEPEGPD
jgi:hypothetical protein